MEQICNAAVRPFARRIGYRVKFSAPQIQGLRFVVIQRPRAAAAKDRELIPAFVHRAVAIDSLRNGQSGPTRAVRGDQLRCRPGAEAGKMSAIVPGRDDLQNAEAVLAIGDESERARGYHADLYVVHIAELALGGEHL